MISGDTIAAIATAPGRGGVAVIRVSGPESFAVAERLTGIGERGTGIHVRKVHSHPVRSLIDECVVLFFKSPRSYTGENVVEFQCHGGSVTPRRILEACLAAGARLARRGEFTERAFLGGKLDYGQTESVLDLIDAKTVRAADAALEGLAGRRSRECRALYEQALDLSTRIEHALDVSEDELPVGFSDELRVKSDELRGKIEEAVCRAREGKILRTGALVVLAGPPNAGKSSLLNALLEENRAIVSDMPGTTRDSVEAWMSLDGWPIRLVDTAGLRESEDDVEAEGVKRSEELIAKADVVVWLEELDGEKASGFEDFRTVPPARLLTVHSKCDLGRGEGLNVSAKTGDGLEELKRAIVAKLGEMVSAADSGDDDAATDVAAFHEALAVLAPLVPGPRSSLPQQDLVLLANAVRSAAERLGAAVGATYSADMLDNLFSRFCVGK